MDGNRDGDVVTADAMELNNAADTCTFNVRSGDTTIQNSKNTKGDTGIDLQDNDHDSCGDEYY